MRIALNAIKNIIYLFDFVFMCLILVLYSIRMIPSDFLLLRWDLLWVSQCYTFIRNISVVTITIVLFIKRKETLQHTKKFHVFAFSGIVITFFGLLYCLIFLRLSWLNSFFLYYLLIPLGIVAAYINMKFFNANYNKTKILNLLYLALFIIHGFVSFVELVGMQLA